MPSAMAQAEIAGALGGGNDTGANPGAATSTPPAQQGTAYSGGCLAADNVVSPQSVQTFAGSVTGPITNLSSAIQSNALDLADRAKPYGLALGGAFAMLTVLFDIMFAMIRKQSIIEPVVGTIIMAMTAAFLLQEYPTVVGFLVNEAQLVAQAITGTKDPITLIGPAFSQMVTGVFKLIAAAIGTNCGWLAIGLHLAAFLLAAVLGIVTLFFVLVSFVELIAIILMPTLALGIGTALGMVFVGLVASRWTQKWFLKWLEFMLAAAILNLIVCVALKLLSSLFDTIANAANKGYGAIVSLLGLMVLSMAIGKFFQSIPGMASAMVPGHHGMSAGGSAAGAAATEGANSLKAAAGGGGGGGGGVGASMASAPSKVAAAMAPMRVAAAAIGGPAAVAAVGMMASTAEAATRGAKAIASGAGATSSGTPAGAENSPAMASLAENLSGGGGATAAPPMAAGGGGATAAPPMAAGGGGASASSATSAVGGPAAVNAARKMAEMARNLANGQGATASPPPPES